MHNSWYATLAHSQSQRHKDKDEEQKLQDPDLENISGDDFFSPKRLRSVLV